MPPGAPIAGDLLARRYRLIDRVGAGGMSVVWRARDEVLDRLVAVKWLGSELADDELFRDLVRREAWATARIKHPAVAAVYDYGEMSGLDSQYRAYVVMEMLDGESLADRLRLGPVPWREAVSICAEVADALATAHEHGVVHRDISPDNVMLTSSGLRVFDFGIAAPIGEPDDDSTGSTFGTPAYVAPERLDGQPAQTATDVYSLGVLLYELLTGRPPFPEDTWDCAAALRERAAPRLRGVAGLPSAVGRLCQRCLAHAPARRPPAREVADRLAAHARAWSGDRLALAVGAALVTVVALFAGVLGWGPLDAPLSAAPIGTGPALDATRTPAAVSGAPSRSGQPTVKPTASARTRPPAGPVNNQPLPTASISVEQAMDELRQVISTNQAAGQIRDDVALDLRNQVESLATRLIFTPSADKQQTVTSISDLRLRVQQRAGQDWPQAGTSTPSDRKAISPAARDELLAAIDTLRAAVG
jgi:hypothetical protein